MGKTKGNEPILSDVEAGIAKLSEWRNPFTSACKRISIAKTIKHKSVIRNKSINSIRFAMISLNMPEGDFRDDNLLNNPLCATKGVCTPIQFKNKWGLETDACRRRLYLSNYRQSYQYLEVYRDAIGRALEEAEANVVCVNELGIATNIYGPLPKFFKEIKKLVERKHALVITGSHHDTRTRYNTGYIFYPGCSNHGQQFHKQVSATTREIGEHICVPSDRQSRLIKAFGFHIAIITCLDLMDYSTISSLVQAADKVDFIVVPASSPKIESLEEIAKIVSGVLPGGIFIVNRYRGKKKSSCIAGFFGELESGKWSLAPIPLGDNGIINIYDIPRDEFDDQKDSIEDILLPSPYQWLLINPLTA